MAKMYRVRIGKGTWNVCIEEEEGQCEACGHPDGYKVVITIPFCTRPDSLLKELYA